MTAQEKQMYEAGGYRERYAMDHGHRTGKYVNGEYCIRYHLTWEQIADGHADSNGATYNTARRYWYKLK